MNGKTTESILPKSMTLAEIWQSFGSEWVLVEFRPGLNLLDGLHSDEVFQVFWHSKDEAEVNRKGLELGRKELAIICTERLAQGPDGNPSFHTLLRFPTAKCHEPVNSLSWSQAAWRCAAWIAGGGALLGVIRVIFLPPNLGVQEFLLWGTAVLVTIPLLTLGAALVHRSWKVGLLVFLLGGLFFLVGLDYFQ